MRDGRIYKKFPLVAAGLRTRVYKKCTISVPPRAFGEAGFFRESAPSGPLRACLPSGGGSLPGCRSQLATLPGIGSRAPDAAGRFRWIRSRSRLPGLSSVDLVRLSAWDLLPVDLLQGFRAVWLPVVDLPPVRCR